MFLPSTCGRFWSGAERQVGTRLQRVHRLHMSTLHQLSVVNEARTRCKLHAIVLNHARPLLPSDHLSLPAHPTVVRAQAAQLVSRSAHVALSALGALLDALCARQERRLAALESVASACLSQLHQLELGLDTLVVRLRRRLRPRVSSTNAVGLRGLSGLTGGEPRYR